MLFHDRVHAGKLLARRLRSASPSIPDPVIVTLPRGGVPVGYEVANKLGAPLDVLVVRKLGAPLQPEYGIGAVTEEGYYWFDEESARAVGVNRSGIDNLLRREQLEVKRRIAQYRQNRPMQPVKGKTVIVIDDGLATGVTARVASRYLRARGARKIVLAVPVCSPETAAFVRREREVDELVCLEEPEIFYSVGQFYENFRQTTDEEVVSLLSRAKLPNVAAQLLVSREVVISLLELPGSLAIPADPKGIVIFAHGSASSRFSPRNSEVAGRLNDAGFGTLLFDLLTTEESFDRRNVFDIPLLAERLILATRWLKQQSEGQGLPLGYFGASTGAGAALWAAAELQGEITAVVSRGGRPDLAVSQLPKVTAPTLLLVGENDESVIAMNEEAMKYLATSNLIVIPGATHLFEEPGTLDLVADEAVTWFTKYTKKATRRVAA